MVTLADVKRANPIWFVAGNKRFIGDVSYKVLHGKATGRPFLVRATNAWTDMFGQPKKLHYRINPINGRGKGIFGGWVKWLMKAMQN